MIKLDRSTNELSNNDQPIRVPLIRIHFFSISLSSFWSSFHLFQPIAVSQAKTRSAGCAAYMAPERIDPPDPTKPDYDVRADVWSLGISLVSSMRINVITKFIC